MRFIHLTENDPLIPNHMYSDNTVPSQKMKFKYNIKSVLQGQCCKKCNISTPHYSFPIPYTFPRQLNGQVYLFIFISGLLRCFT